MISFGLNRLSTKAAVAVTVLGFAVALAGGSPAIAQEKVRVALPTKTYYPTIISETALRQGLFKKEGIDAELTVYRGGAEAFEAVAAGAADITVGSTAMQSGSRAVSVAVKPPAGAGARDPPLLSVTRYSTGVPA